jgi:hypothetical protein
MPDDLESDIQATAEDIVADAQALQALETEKAALDTSDPEALELAAKAERMARGIVSKTVAERELVTEGQEPSGPPEGTAA